MGQRRETAYHPYVAFIAHFDHAESIRLQPQEAIGEPLLEIANRFSTDCRRIRTQLTRACVATGPNASSSADPNVAYAPHLFRPLCFAALGQTDDLAIVLLDNLPLVTRLTAVGRAIEDSEVAFCPRIDSLRLRAQDEVDRAGLSTSNPTWPFHDLHTLVADGEFDSEPDTEGDWSNQEAMPQPLRSTPFCVASRFKLNTLASLGHGSLLYQEVLESMAETIRRACLAFIDEESKQIDNYAGPFLETSDIKNLKCAFLASQSAEDVTLLCFCANYSVAQILIAALRNLTLGDVLENADPDVVETLLDPRFGRFHGELSRYGSKLAGRANGPSFDSIRGNHVFMTTFTTLCVAHHAMRAPDEAGVSGYVEAYLNVDLKPGHERSIRERLESVHESVFGNRKPHLAVDDRLKKISVRMTSGLHDEIVNVSPDPADRFQPGSVVRTADALKFLYRFFSKQDDGANDFESGFETGFLDLSTSFIVPIPQIERDAQGHVVQPGSEAIAAGFPHGEVQPRVDSGHHHHGVHVFRQLREAVEREFGLDDSLQFRDGLRTIGCPASLQYSLVRVFDEFVACIDDPLRCIPVLDLYESFAALNVLLRRDLPEYLSGIADPVRRRKQQSHLFEKSTLRDFIDALQDTFTLRLQRAVPNHQTRDTAFNFRGGVSKFLAAMDVPVKCSLGLFRRMFGFETDRVNEAAFKQRFAAVTSLSIGQQTTVESVTFSKKRHVGVPTKVEEFPVYFTRFNIDVMRLYGPEQIAHFLHEFAHLHFDTFVFPDVDDFADYISAEDYAYALDRDGHAEYVRNATAEVFAELITHLFIFESDTDLFAKFYAIGFSEVQDTAFQEVPRAAESSYDERLTNGLIEAMYRSFLVVDSVRYVHDSQNKQVADWPDDHPLYDQPCDSKAATEAWQRFENYVRDYGPYYRDYRQLWGTQTTDVWKRCEERFRAFYTAPKQTERLRRVWRSAMSVYLAFRSTLLQPSESGENDTLPRDLNELGSSIEECLGDGRAFRRMQWPGRREGPVQSGGVDSLLVVCKLAYHYIRGVYGDISKDKLIYLGPDDDQTHGSTAQYNRFLISASHFPMYCVDPGAREERLLKQIACFTTLCDISSQLRARRVIDMLALLQATSSS